MLHLYREAPETNARKIASSAGYKVPLVSTCLQSQHNTALGHHTVQSIPLSTISGTSLQDTIHYQSRLQPRSHHQRTCLSSISKISHEEVPSKDALSHNRSASCSYPLCPRTYHFRSTTFGPCSLRNSYARRSRHFRHTINPLHSNHKGDENDVCDRSATAFKPTRRLCPEYACEGWSTTSEPSTDGMMLRLLASLARA